MDERGHSPCPHPPRAYRDDDELPSQVVIMFGGAEEGEELPFERPGLEHFNRALL